MLVMVTKVVEVFSHHIRVPVGGMTLIVFLMICDVLGGALKVVWSGF